MLLKHDKQSSEDMTDVLFRRIHIPAAVMTDVMGAKLIYIIIKCIIVTEKKTS